MVLIDADKHHDWLFGAVPRRLREELAKLQVEINDEKSCMVDLGRGEGLSFPGFDFRYLRCLRGVKRPNYSPKLKQGGRRSCGRRRGCFADIAATD